jgi:UDP-N-acetylglucosamine diphosphorylase/glucosamine-1-phosphate N-acetyltransferase
MPALPPILLFEDSHVDRLHPLTYSRAAFEFRAGGMTLLERVLRNLPRAFRSAPGGGENTTLTGVLVRAGLADVLRQRLPSVTVNPSLSLREGVLLLNARWLMFAKEADAFRFPDLDTAGLVQGTVVWARLSAETAREVDLSLLHEPAAFDRILPRLQRVSVAPAPTMINRPWDLLDVQRTAIEEDFATLGKGPEGGGGNAIVMPGAHLLARENVHLGKGVKIWPGAVLDAQAGPILLGEGTEIRANAVLTGPLSVGPRCLVKVGADLHDACTLGPNSRVGGEISNTLFLGNCNKQHHGFVGNSIIGEWANLGAGTTTSNLKNTYGTVKMPLQGTDEATGRMFLGSVIADHAKLGIGTYLSTGTVVGFASHVVVPRPPRFVPSFAWVTEKGLERADFEKLESIAATVMKRRGQEFTQADHELWVRIASEWAQGEQFSWPDPDVF